MRQEMMICMTNWRATTPQAYGNVQRAGLALGAATARRGQNEARPLDASNRASC